MNIAAWIGYPGLFLIITALVVLFRWMGLMQRRVNQQAERIAHLEGQRDC